MADVYGISYTAMLAKLKQKYDGYHFSKDLVNIYNPFSLCVAFAKKDLGDHWFATGTPYFMVNMLEQKLFDIPDLEGSIKVNIKEMDDYRLDYTNIAPLLFQAGYLTIKNYDDELRNFTLGFPNDEVRYAFLDRLINVYTSPIGAIINEDKRTLGEWKIERV